MTVKDVVAMDIDSDKPDYVDEDELDLRSLSLKERESLVRKEVSDSEEIPKQNLTLQPRSNSVPLVIPPRAQASYPDDGLRKAAILPYILSGYVQLGFSIAIAGFWLYLLTSFANTIFADIDNKVQLFSETVMQEIADCSRNYRENRCDPSTRVPAIANACGVWEACMGRDPYVVARRTKIGVETIGESLNSFFETLTWKTIACLVLLSCGLLLVHNLAGFLGRGGLSQAFENSGSRARGTRDAAARRKQLTEY